jgi:hypothetical protein
VSVLSARPGASQVREKEHRRRVEHHAERRDQERADGRSYDVRPE